MPPPTVLLDMGLRAGPHGKAVSMKALNDAPHGIDLGALQPSLLQRLETPDRKIHCAPEAFVADLKRVESRADRSPRAGRRAAAGRPAPPAQQQLLDAQRPSPDEGAAP